MILRALAWLLILPLPAFAQDDLAVATAEAQAALRAAQGALTASESATDRVMALTDVVRGYESALAATRDGLRRVDAQRDMLQADLDGRQADVAQLLGALQTVSRAPPPIAELHPDGPLNTIRAGMLIADMTPALQAKVTTLRAQLDHLAALTALQTEVGDALKTGLTGAQEARAALGTAIQNRAPLPKRFDEDPIQTALLMANTDTLGKFVAALQAALPPGETDANVNAEKGMVPLPVTGQLRRAFNTEDAAGVVRPGILIEAAAHALVTAPLPATIMFRGELLDYENVIILEPTQGVMFIFAGLAEVYGTAGDIVQAGAPLGILGGAPLQTNANLTTNTGEDGGTLPQTLYLEVRDGQTPVDPATWFALEQE